MGYLSKEGLTYLWSKITSYVDAHAGGAGSNGGPFENFEAGKDWIVVSLPSSASWHSVTYGDGKFVAVARNSNQSIYSEDGTTWTKTTLPSSADWRSVAYGDGKFVTTVYNSSVAAYSEDGITWTQTTLPSSANWSSVTYGDGKFVAVAYNSNKSAYSEDGITWMQTTLPLSTYWQSVAYGDGKFVVVAYNSNKSAYSEDGITWTQTTLPLSTYWYSVTYGDGKFVAVSNNSGIAALSFTGKPPNNVEGKTYTAGNGLEITDEDVINILNPVCGIFSQEEYDALTEEEKNNGTYFVGTGDSSNTLTMADVIAKIDDKVGNIDAILDEINGEAM